MILDKGHDMIVVFDAETKAASLNLQEVAI